MAKESVPWEQFTTFWVEAAMINTHSEVREFTLLNDLIHEVKGDVSHQSSYQ